MHIYWTLDQKPEKNCQDNEEKHVELINVDSLCSKSLFSWIRIQPKQLSKVQ